jgi:putative oxidoreductase
MTDHAVESKKLFVPSLAGLYESLSPYTDALVRFTVGVIMMPHGYVKVFGPFATFIATRIFEPWGLPAPLAVAYGIGALEFFGGACLALGLFTRLIAALFAIEFAVITFGATFKNGFFFTAPNGGGYEYPLLVLVLMIAIAIRGSGRCALDRLMGKEF